MENGNGGDTPKILKTYGRVVCACCGRDITRRMKIYMGKLGEKEAFCYECYQKRVKHEQTGTGA